jgi:hypothetical protein
MKLVFRAARGLEVLRRRSLRLLKALRRRGFLVRIVLVALLLVVGLGLVGLMQDSTVELAGGNTSLSYSLLRKWRGSGLQALEQQPSFEMHAGKDAVLQNYFDIDAQTGALKLRDGLRTINTSMNPLSVFPVLIRDLRPATPEQSGQAKEPQRVFVHVVDCPTFLQLAHEASKTKNQGVPSSLLKSDRVAGPGWSGDSDGIRQLSAVARSRLCAAAQPPFILGQSNVRAIRGWLKWKAYDPTEWQAGATQAASPPVKPSAIDAPAALRISMLAAQKQFYEQELNKVFHESEVRTAEQIESSKSKEKEQDVREIVVLGDRAEPMTVIVDPLAGASGGQSSGVLPSFAGVLPCSDPGRCSDPLWRASAGGASAGNHPKMLPDENSFLAWDWWLLSFRRLRLPALVVAGVIIPLLALLMRYRCRIVRLTLQPYLFLVLAQIAVMVVADMVMGAGLVLWVGLVFTLLRLVQLVGLFSFAQAASRPRRRDGRLLWQPSWLRPLLALELLLWSVNGIGLASFIISVFSRWEYISPA